MRKALFTLLLVLALIAPLSAQQETRIAFGSCLHQSRPQPIWDAVYAARPDMFVLLGDNIYGDTDDMRVLKAKYDRLAKSPGFQLIRSVCPVIATWDDHDYGRNDAGAEYPHKMMSKRIFLDFFEEPVDSARRIRPGVYTSYHLGPPERRVQVLLLDTRWSRSPLSQVSRAEWERRKMYGMGPYTPNPDESAQLLGDDQWEWLELQLRQPARVRLICSSIPILQEGTGWEVWANFPREKQRLFDTIAATEAEGVLFLVGDTHWAEFSKLSNALPFPLWELNSSGLTENWEAVPPNSHRLGGTYAQDNFGLVKIDWSRPDPQITLEARAVDNDLLMQNTLRLSELSRPAAP